MPPFYDAHAHIVTYRCVLHQYQDDRARGRHVFNTNKFSEEHSRMRMLTSGEISEYCGHFNLAALLETEDAGQTEPEWLQMCISLLQRCALDAKPSPAYTITGKKDR